MALKDALKSGFEGFTKSLGGSVAALVWSSLVVGGPIVTWFASPTVYSIQLTRIQATTLVLVLVLSIALTGWITRALSSSRRKFHLTPHGMRNIWGTTTLANGSVNAQFSADFVVKNMSGSVQRLIAVKMVAPRVTGDVIHAMIFGPAGSVLELKPDAAKTANVQILVQGARMGGRDGDLDVVFAIANDEGYEQRVKAKLRKLVAVSLPTGAASTGSPVATKTPSP